MLSSISTRRISISCAVITVLLGALGIIGWGGNFALLTSFRQDFIPISPNTSLLFLLLGASLIIQWYYPGPAVRLLSLCISLFPIFIGVITILEVLTGIPTGINSLVFHSSSIVESYPAGNMSPITAGCFVIFGCISLMLSLGNAKYAGLGGVITGITGSVILIGYGFGTPLLYGGTYIPVALLSGLDLVVFSCALIARSGSDHWPLNQVSGQSTRARLFRSLLPVLIFLVFSFSWIQQVILTTISLNPALITAIEVILATTIWVLVLSRMSRIIGDQIDHTTDALKESEEKYRIIAESTSDVIWHFDLGTMTFSYVSPSVKQMRGFSPQEVRDAPLSASFTPESYAVVVQLIKERLESIQRSNLPVSDSYTDLLDQPCRDGSIIHTEITTKAIKDCRIGNYGLIGVTRDVTERVISHAALLSSERRFKAIFNSTFQFMALLAPDGTVLDINNTSLSFGGFLREEVVGKPFWDTRWWTYSSHIRSNLIDSVHVASLGRFIRYEVQVRGGDDHLVTIDFSLKPVYDDAGAVSLLIAEGRDISETKKTEERLTILAALLEVSPAGVIVHDEKGTIIFTNSAELDYHAYTREEFLSHTLSDLTVPDDTALIQKRMESITANHIQSFTVHHYRKDGSIIPLEVYARKTRVGDRDLIVSVNIDITDRILKDEQIRLERDRAELYLNIVEVMIMVLDRNGKVILINRKGEEILGLPHSAIIGADWYSTFVPLADQMKGFSAFTKILSGNIGGYASFENIIRAGDGSEKVLSMKSVLLTTGDEVCGLLISGEDVTAMRHLEGEKKEAIRQIQQNLVQLAILNDEIRNPLTVITCIAERATDAQTFRSLYEQINRIDDLINGLDRRWADSENVLSFLKKHYSISVDESSDLHTSD